MNKLITYVIALVLLALSACTSVERTAYRVYGSTAIAVDAAMNNWGLWVKNGKASVADEARVKAVYEKYQASQRVVQDLVKAGLYSKDQLDFACTAASSAGVDVINLVKHITTKQ